VACKAAKELAEEKLKDMFEIWNGIDEFVRPRTALGYKVSDKVLELLKSGEAAEAKLAEIEKQELAVEDITSQRWSKEAEFFGSEPQKRIGDIHIGGEITEEFKNSVSVVATGFIEEWCKHCGLDQRNGMKHLHSCPTLKSKL